MNGLLPELRKLRENFSGKFIIPKDVKYEIIDKPITIKRFELEALKLKQLLDEKVLEMPDVFNVDENLLKSKTQELKNVANKTFFGKGRDIHLIDSGEASCLALGKLLDKRKGFEYVLAIDERTTRLLCEKPEALQKNIEKKLHTKLKVKKENYKFFQGFKIIRSCEIAYIINKNNLTRIKDPIILDAMLYALKFKGCAIGWDEIKEIKQIA